MTGPAQKHPSVRNRRNSPAAGVTTLPKAGRRGKAPDWPLTDDLGLVAEKRVADAMVCEAQEALELESDGRKRRSLTKALERVMLHAEKLAVMVEGAAEAELTLWTELWKTPQATEWQRTRSHRAVAMYVRWQIKAENGHLEAAKEARMWSDRLGLNPLALHRLKQEVERSDAAATQGTQRRSAAAEKRAADAAAAKAAQQRAAGDPRGGLFAV